MKTVEKRTLFIHIGINDKTFSHSPTFVKVVLKQPWYQRSLEKPSLQHFVSGKKKDNPMLVTH